MAEVVQGRAGMGTIAKLSGRAAVYLLAGLALIALPWAVTAIRDAPGAGWAYPAYVWRAILLALVPPLFLLLAEVAFLAVTPRSWRRHFSARLRVAWLERPFGVAGIYFLVFASLAFIGWATFITFWMDLSLPVHVPAVVWQDRVHRLFIELPLVGFASGCIGLLIWALDRTRSGEVAPWIVRNAAGLAWSVGGVCAVALTATSVGFTKRPALALQMLGFLAFAIAFGTVYRRHPSFHRLAGFGALGGLTVGGTAGLVLLMTHLGGADQRTLALLDSNRPAAVHAVGAALGRPSPDRWAACPWWTDRWPDITDLDARDVVLVTVESLAAEYDGATASTDAVTPNLNALAADAAVFKNAMSPGPRTSFGLVGVQHGMNMRCARVTPDARQPTLFQILSAAGFHTALVSGFHFGVLGSRVFPHATTVVAGIKEQHYVLDDNRWLKTLPQDERVREIAEDVIRGAPTDQPLALWVHFMDPHHVYNPPPDLLGTRGRGRLARYQEEVNSTDRELGKLLATLERRRPLGRALVAILGDHGQALRPLGPRFHATGIGRDMVHTPLLIIDSGVGGRRIDVPVSLMDVPPTILEILGAESPGSFQGRSLLPVMRGEAVETVPVQLDMAGRADLSDGVILGEYKLIRRLRQNYAPLYPNDEILELYQHRLDPDERRNLADALPDLVRRLYPHLPREVFPLADQPSIHTARLRGS